MAVPSLPFLSKDSLRSAALDARKAFVRTLGDSERTRLEDALAVVLRPLCAEARAIGGYCALGSEISPLRTLEAAAVGGATICFPAFDDPAKPFRFRCGDPVCSGPFGIQQPDCAGEEVRPDLVLVPLIAVDGRGTRLGRGKGHYDKVLVSARRNGARLVGVGWPMQRLQAQIPSDPWDVPLHAFASPEGLEEFQ